MIYYCIEIKGTAVLVTEDALPAASYIVLEKGSFSDCRKAQEIYYK